MKTTILLLIAYLLISMEIQSQVITIETTLDSPCAALKTPTSTVDNFLIYPNPVSYKLFIDLKTTNNNNTSIKIYDVKGSLVYRKEKLPYEGYINLDKLKNGFYFLIFEEAKNRTTKKLVIQR